MLNSRGQIRVLESILAVTIIFSALLLTNFRYEAYDEGLDDLYYIGLNALSELDKHGELGYLIEKGMWSDLSKRIQLLLPFGIFYNITVYDENGQRIHASPIIVNSVMGRNVVSIEYLVVSRENRHFYVIKLQLAWVR